MISISGTFIVRVISWTRRNPSSRKQGIIDSPKNIESSILIKTGDPNIDIVIFVRQQRQQPQQPQQKKSIEALAATGTPPLHPSLSQN